MIARWSGISIACSFPVQRANPALCTREKGSHAMQFTNVAIARMRPARAPCDANSGPSHTSSISGAIATSTVRTGSTDAPMSRSARLATRAARRRSTWSACASTGKSTWSAAEGRTVTRERRSAGVE